jgi:hypothetical protein
MFNVLVARRVARSVRYPPLLHTPPGIPAVTSSVYVIPSFPCNTWFFPFLQLLTMKTLHLSMQSSKFVFRLPANGEVGGEILFRLHGLNSGWILIPTIEGKGLQEGSCWSFNLLCFQDLYRPILCEFWNTMKCVCLGLFCMCLGFHCPSCVSVRSDNGVTFWVVSYVLFWVFCLDRSSWSWLQVW